MNNLENIEYHSRPKSQEVLKFRDVLEEFEEEIGLNFNDYLFERHESEFISKANNQEVYDYYDDISRVYHFKDFEGFWTHTEYMLIQVKECNRVYKL